MQMIYDRLMCYVRYGADAEDYIGLELYRKSALERDTFITARRNYKWLYKNHYTESDRAILLSKCSFNPVYASFFKRRWMSSRDNDIASINTFIDSLGEVIVKPDRGLQGLGVYKIKATDEAKRDEFINSVRCGQDYVIEEVIRQHPDMAYFNDSCVNTCRIETVTDRQGGGNLINTVVIIGGRGSEVSNTHTGGVMVHVDPDTGIVDSKGRNPEGRMFVKHPGTGAVLLGRKIPFWEETKALAIELAEFRPTMRCVGWDIAITENGPELIEGNIQFGHCTQACDMIGRWPLIMKYL